MFGWLGCQGLVIAPVRRPKILGVPAGYLNDPFGFCPENGGQTEPIRHKPTFVKKYGGWVGCL